MKTSAFKLVRMNTYEKKGGPFRLGTLPLIFQVVILLFYKPDELVASALTNNSGQHRKPLSLAAQRPDSYTGDPAKSCVWRTG